MSYSKGFSRKTLYMLYIICVLLLASSVSASLYVSHVEGSDRIKDFRRVTDTVSFNISSTSEITSINGASAVCQKESFRYYCAVTDTKNQATVTYNIVNQEGNTATANINVDNSIGAITYSVSQNNGNVTLTYSITDTGYNNNPPCTGIEKIDVWWQGSNTDILEFENNNCAQSGSRTLAITESGKGEFYLEATDRIGNTKKSLVQNIIIDVSLPEVSNLEVWNNGLPLNTIASNTDFQVDITFDIAEENLTSVIVDLSDITNNPQLKSIYKNTVVPLSACRINNTESGRVYNCIINSKVLRTNKDSVFINVTAKDGAGNTVVERLEKSFTLDNVVPEVQIITDYCDEDDRCYVKNGLNKFIFQLTKDNFEKRLIFFEIAGVSSRVFNCSGNECVGFANINCNGPTQIRILTVNPSSQDDSGNKLPYYSRMLQCDNSMPSIIDINWGSNSELGENLLITGATVSLAVTVNEPDSKVLASAYFDKMKNETISATCIELAKGLGNVFNCTWSVSPIEDGYYDADVVINVSDIVNNSVTRTERVRILGFKADNLTPTNLRATYSNTVPSSLNRAVLQLAEFNKIPMYAHAYYSVSVKHGQDVQLLSQELSLDNCVLRERDGDMIDASYLFSEIKLADTYKGIGDNHRIDFTFGQSAGGYNKFADDTRVVCNVSAFVREGKYVYKKPQILMIEIPFKLRNSQFDAPGEEYVKRIKALEESTTDDYSKLIQNLDAFMVAAQNICTIKNTLDYAGMSGVAVQLAGFALGPLLGQPFKQSGGQIFSLYQDINSIFYDPNAVDDPFMNSQSGKELPGMGIIGQACTFMSCNLDWNNPLKLDEGLANSIEGSLKDLPLGVGSELTEGLTNSDLKNSIVMSAQKLCIPGIVYNLNKYRQMDCEYLECLKVYGASGLDVSQCEVMKASKTCAIIVGEAFELPYVRIGKNLFSNMADTIRMSYGYGLVSILKYINSTGICDDPTSDAAIISCNLPYAIQEYISAQKKTRMSRDFYYQQTRDFCESAGCVGPDCYPNNQIYGIPLPQFVPTRDQQIQMDLMRRFGPLVQDRYLIVAAHGSADEKIRRENLEEWNKRVREYNKNHGTNYPEIPDVDKLYAKTDDAQAKLSNYYNQFGEIGGTPEEQKKFNQKINDDPRTNYQIKINELQTIQKNIENNPFYIGKKSTWNDMNVIENTKFESQKNYQSLLKVLPYGMDMDTIYDSDASTEKDKFYYFKDNTLYYHEKNNGEIKIVTYNADGEPSEYHLDELPRPLEKWQAEFVNRSGPEKLKTKETFDKFAKDKEEFDKKKPDYDAAREKYRKYMLEQKALVFVNLFMDQFGMRKFLTAEYWVDKWGLGEYVTEVADAVDPQIWKNNLCNPDNGPFIAGSDQPEGTVYSCYNQPGQGCKLVLTYGAEYLYYGNNTYLYTVSYLAGPVLRDTRLTVKLKGPQGTLSSAERILRANNYDSSAQAFLSNKKYTQICVSFTGNFPDIGDPAKEFCRAIREDVLRTGKPYIDETTLGYPSGNIGNGQLFR